MMNLFREIPLWGVFIITVFVVYLAFEGGRFIGNRHRLLSKQEDVSPIGSIVAATLGLLAFLLAFTFGIAATKFDERRALVVDEANAIQKTYLRAGYLPESYKTDIQKLLKEYVSVRIEALKPGKLAYGLKRSEELQDQLWLQAEAIAEKYPNSEIVALFIEAVNDVLDWHVKRVNIGIRTRIPSIIWEGLYFVTVLAVGSLGYQCGLAQTRYIEMIVLLILTFSSVITLIADLDRPQQGFITVSQQPLIDLEEKWNRTIRTSSNE